MIKFLSLGLIEIDCIIIHVVIISSQYNGSYHLLNRSPARSHKSRDTDLTLLDLFPKSTRCLKPNHSTDPPPNPEVNE